MRSILIVDDDIPFAQTLARAVTKANCRVLVANAPAEALRILNVEDVDMVLSDDSMPGMRGTQFLAKVRELKPNTVRVLMTGSPSVESAIHAVNNEVFRYLTKPFTIETLVALIDDALADGKPKVRHDRAVVDRKRHLLTSLEEAHPGLLEVPEGVYRPVDSGNGLAFQQMANNSLDGLVNTLERVAFEGYAESFDPLRLADDLLILAMRLNGTTISVEPARNAHVILFDTGSRSLPFLSLSSGVGDGLAARLATLARLDLSLPGNQSGGIGVRYNETQREILVSLRTSAIGLGLELRREIDEAEVTAPVVATPTTSSADMIPGYHLLEPIGEGGLGIVYRAVQNALNRPCAVKLLRPSVLSAPLASQRMLREARAASRPKHPGIVAVLDCGRLTDQRAYIVMELVESPTLSELLVRNQTLPAEDAVKIARRVAEALDAAHEVGVVHRDVKPSNIFVDEAELTVKLSDFGAAKIVDDTGPALTAVGMTIGTPHYMSPEQARNIRVDRRTDIYALGCVLFEMLCGEPPYVGQNSVDVVSQHVLSPVPAPYSPRAPLPLALTRTIQRAMSKNPSERHQTAKELIADLENAWTSVSRTGWRRWLP